MLSEPMRRGQSDQEAIGPWLDPVPHILRIEEQLLPETVRQAALELRRESS